MGEPWVWERSVSGGETWDGGPLDRSQRALRSGEECGRRLFGGEELGCFNEGGLKGEGCLRTVLRYRKG